MEERMNDLEILEEGFAHHFIPVEGEWYTVAMNQVTERIGIAHRDVRVVSIDVKADTLTQRSYVEGVVEDEAGYRYQVPHFATQALYKRQIPEPEIIETPRDGVPAVLVAVAIVAAAAMAMVLAIYHVLT